MIDERDAVLLARETDGDRRRLLTALSTAVEGPPRSLDLSPWLWVTIVAGLLVAVF